LHSLFFCPLPPRSPPPYVLLLPPSSALTVSSQPLPGYYHFVAAVTHIAATRRLDYDTRLVAAPPTHPPSAGGELALGYDILEDRQFELELLAAASPHLCAMLLAHEEEPDAPDISTPRTYVEAASRQRASQWIASMDLEMSSWRSTSTYVDAIPPLWENVVDDMWIFKWNLRRLVYGLRQAPRNWHDTLRSTLADLVFGSSFADQTLFVRYGSTPFFILLYTDDLVHATVDRVALA
ncbi:unnamed protein product, partial [Closterium sp. NIES-53]